MVKQAHLRIGVYWYIFPTYRDAKDTVWRDPGMLSRIAPDRLISKRNDSELVLYFKNGSIIQLKGASEENSLRGPNPLGVVLDEYATMNPDAWGVLEPILRANDGWCWFIGTPKGKNHLYHMYLKGQEDNKEWKSWILKASTSGIVRPEQLEESKKGMSSALFNQEWECEFLEGEGSVFRNVKAIATAEPRRPVEGHYYVMGVDLAKHTDYTVIAVYDRTDNNQVYQDRFKTIEWPFQKKRIKAIAEHYNRAHVLIDATGLGDPIADDLLREGLNIEPYKFTEQSKKELIEKLSIWIEQRRIKILPIEETINELENYSYEIGPTGRIRYGAPEGFNDDIVTANALAVWSLNPVHKIITERETSPIQQAFRQAQRAYEQQQREEWGEETIQ